MDSAVFSCLVVKHSWKGKFRRIFCVSEGNIATYNPSTLESTNQWEHGEVTGLKPMGRVGSSGEFSLSIRRKAKTEILRFSSEFRLDILSEAMRFNKFFATPVTERQSQRFNAAKCHWSGGRKPVILEVLPYSLNQLDPNNGEVLAEFEYRRIGFICRLSDEPDGMVLGLNDTEAKHLFFCNEVESLIKAISSLSLDCMGWRLHIREEPMTLSHFMSTRIGEKFCTDEHLTSMVEFNVSKITRGVPEAMRRILCLSETCILERDAGSYNIINLHPFNKVFLVVRSESDPQVFGIEYQNGEIRSFTSTDRDSLLAALLDGLRASGNQNAHIGTRFLNRGLRVIPLHSAPDEETESQLLKFIFSPPVGMNPMAVMQRFNANIPYSGLIYSVTQEGLFSQNKEKLIINALATIIDYADDLIDWELYFQCLRRIFASKAGFHAFTGIPKFREKLGVQIVSALRNNNAYTNYMALEVLCALVQPMHNNFDIRQEQMNKAAVLSSRSFIDGLMDMMINHLTKRSGTLVICSMLDFLTYILCLPFCETTMGDQFDMVLEIVASRGRQFFQLFQSNSSTIVKGAGLLMRAFIEESDEKTSTYMQSLSLSEGSFLLHLNSALFTDSRDIRMLRNRQISRHLIATWSVNNTAAVDLLHRIFPIGLLTFLKSSDKVPDLDSDILVNRNNLSLAEEDSMKQKNFLGDVQQRIGGAQKLLERQLDSLLLHWKVSQRRGSVQNGDSQQNKPVVLRRRRERVKITDNWKLFFYQFTKDHTKADLVWNHRTRDELRSAIAAEIRLFNSDKSLSSQCEIAWNHQEFQVFYASLAAEVMVGGYFLRILLEETKNSASATPIECPSDFFNAVYHQFLINRTRSELSYICLDAMGMVYRRYHTELGPFGDAAHIVEMLADTESRQERDLLVLFLTALLEEPKNVKVIAQAGGFRILVDLLCLAHLHTSRPLLPAQRNEIEDSEESCRAKAPEWYYRVAGGKSVEGRQGPFGFDQLTQLYKEGKVLRDTSCWAAGMDDWRPLRDIPQLRWTLVASDSPLMNESDLAVVILDGLNCCCKLFPSRDLDRVIRPIPLFKRFMSDSTILPHVVQLLLTFESRIVERTANLLFHIVTDNPVAPRLYLTGLFYFALMYPGSNVGPIAKLLHLTHNLQAWRSEDPLKSDLIRSSILSSILPDANVFYLSHWGADRFAEVFLGEFDDPEVIWNSEMRRFMIELLALHIADFSVRLQSNIAAVYHFCPVPTLRYPQLETELFVHIYYLRHLCDVKRFANWEIRDPVEFLKSCLKGWQDEVQRKGMGLSTEESMELLGLSPDQLESQGQSAVRKAYFKAAQQYHPDKNPEGREMFERVNRAYEVLSSPSVKNCFGPDPYNLLLFVQAQCVLYSRHCEDLAPFKYAGYTQLIRTLEREIEDEKLFANPFSSLEAAVELCFLTVKCSALNAEQLRREGGLEILHSALSRCVDVIGTGSQSSDRAVNVCRQICRCYDTAARFQGCCDVLKTIEPLPADLCRLLKFTHLVRLNIAVCECVSSLAQDADLQQSLYETGALWLVIPNLFNYDYTLSEGGVERNEDSNQQELLNRQAVASLKVCYSLAGFDESRPSNGHVVKVLKVLLTPYFCRLIATAPTETTLKLLNTNTENPYSMWNNGCRAELLSYVEQLSKKSVDEVEVFSFQYSCHQTELTVGQSQPIFVRIYNDQRTFPIEEPKEFCVDLLEFICDAARFILSSRGVESAGSKEVLSLQRTNDLDAVLEALINLLQSDQSLSILSIGRLKELFLLLESNVRSSVLSNVLTVLTLLVTKEEVISDVAAVNGIVSLCAISYSNPSVSLAALKIVSVILSNGQIMKASLACGGPLYLLNAFCNAAEVDVRISSATVIARIMADRQIGPPTRLRLLRFLPPLFLDAMRDQPTLSVRMFDERIENPELIWDVDVMRNNVKTKVGQMTDEFYELQQVDRKIVWTLPENFAVVYDLSEKSELFIGGVFIRLYITNPSWRLRNPDQFMVDLIDRIIAEMRQKTANVGLLDTLSSALCCFLENNPDRANQIPSQGYLPHIFNAAKSSDPLVAKVAVSAIRLIARNKNCVEHMTTFDSLQSVMAPLQNHPDLIPVTCQTLRTIFEQMESDLVSQALNCQLPTVLLRLLSSNLGGKNPASTKAEIVKTLKLMSMDINVGLQVISLLEKSSVWSEFKEQRHDLFIETAPAAGYITAGSNVAGYLTEGPTINSRLPVSPPD